jgi:hypothetical protein
MVKTSVYMVDQFTKMKQSTYRISLHSELGNSEPGLGASLH